MRATRDFKCCAGAHCLAACDAFQMTLSVESPPGQLIGSVRQDCSCLPPKYNVLDASEQVVLQIEGPACMCFPQFCDQKFDVSEKPFLCIEKPCLNFALTFAKKN